MLTVICVGNIFAGDDGEAILKDGLVDMIAVGRGFLLVPAWARKALAGETPNQCLRCKSLCGIWMERYALQENCKEHISVCRSLLFYIS